MLTWEPLRSEVHMSTQHGTCAQKRASMASAEASRPWPSSSACSMPTRARKLGLAMILFTASATPMWRWICGSALSAAAKSRSSARLRSPAYTSTTRVHSTQTSAPEHLVQPIIKHLISATWLCQAKMLTHTRAHALNLTTFTKLHVNDVTLKPVTLKNFPWHL